MGRWEKVWPLLRHSEDPTLRSYLIDRLGPGGAAARSVIERLNPESEPDVSARRALLLALGEFDPDRLPLVEREALLPKLLQLYRDDPDAGTHGAAGWLLRQWGQKGRITEIDRGLASGKVEGNRQWYVNRQGQTLVLVPPGEYMEPAIGGAELRTVRVERRFALAAREVTVAEFLRFRKGHRYYEASSPDGDCPVNSVNWYLAAAYCNWLSNEEDIPWEQWCYEPVAGKGVNREDDFSEERYKAGMKIKANALSLSGYRLPTTTEWELACRAGSVTQWSMGEAEDLLGKYAWYNANSPTRSRPVGLLRPNDLGLFDLHGNAGELCHNWSKTVVGDGEEIRPLAGGSFDHGPLEVRSNSRRGVHPDHRDVDFGFRPAKTSFR
jgi:formylglycine-generating enzyme required for sulfatase activity